jgi:hypothetical protein
MGRGGRRAGGRAMLDYRCGGNRRVLMVAITGTLGSGLGRDCPRCLAEDRSTRGAWGRWLGSGSSHSNRVRRVLEQVVVVVLCLRRCGAEMVEIRLSTLLLRCGGGSVKTQAEGTTDGCTRTGGSSWRRARAWDSQRVLRRMRGVESRATCE